MTRLGIMKKIELCTRVYDSTQLGSAACVSAVIRISQLWTEIMPPFVGLCSETRSGTIAVVVGIDQWRIRTSAMVTSAQESFFVYVNKGDMVVVRSSNRARARQSDWASKRSRIFIELDPPAHASEGVLQLC